MLPVVIIETLNLMDIKAGVGVPPVGGVKLKAKTELKRILKGLAQDRLDSSGSWNSWRRRSARPLSFWA
jgi:hypothetical protein